MFSWVRFYRHMIPFLSGEGFQRKDSLVQMNPGRRSPNTEVHELLELVWKRQTGPKVVAVCIITSFSNLRHTFLLFLQLEINLDTAPQDLLVLAQPPRRQEPKTVCHVHIHTLFALCHRTEVHILLSRTLHIFIESLWDAIALVSARQMKCGSPPWTYLTYWHKLLSFRWAPFSKVSHDGGPPLNIFCFKRNTIVGRMLVSPSSCRNKFH